MLEGADGIGVQCKDEGKGPPLRLAHSSFGDLNDWDEWVGVPAKDYRVIRLDLPALGSTGPVPSGNYCIDRSLTLVDARMDHLGLGCFTIVGTDGRGLQSPDAPGLLERRGVESRKAARASQPRLAHAAVGADARSRWQRRWRFATRCGCGCHDVGSASGRSSSVRRTDESSLTEIATMSGAAGPSRR